MAEEFWIVLSLIAIVAAASLYFGYTWGRKAEFDRWSNGFLEEFKAKYMKKLTEAFTERVELRAKQLSRIMKFQEEEKDDETTDSN